MSNRIYGELERAKMQKIVQEGITIMSEIETLKEGLSETVKAVAEELEIKPALINKVIKIGLKGDWDRIYSDFEELEALIDLTNTNK